MKYNLRKKHVGQTIHFYFTFIQNDGFINYLENRPGIKSDIDAMSVAISRSNNTLRVIVSADRCEQDVETTMHNILTFEYNLFLVDEFSHPGGQDITSIFSELLFGNSKQGK